MISGQYSPDVYTGAGNTATYTFTFRILAKTDLIAITKGTTITQLVLDQDYTIQDNFVNNPTGGNVVLSANLPVGTTLFLYRRTALTQAVHIEEGGAFPATVVEEVFDRLTMFAQDLYEITQRCLKFALASTYRNIDVPDPIAGNVLQWNGTATGLQNTLASALALTTTIVTATVTAGASQVVLAHSLGASAKLIGLATDWQTTFAIIAQDSSSITLEFSTESPGTGTVTAEIAA